MVTAIVIDDDFDTVEVFQEFLELKKIQVLGAGYDGKDAVELYQKLNPDVVFLDVMMPNHDGFYGLEKIKKINPDASVIMVTGDLTADTEDRLHDLKASEIIYKPYDINEVMAAVERALNRRSQKRLVTVNASA